MKIIYLNQFSKDPQRRKEFTYVDDDDYEWLPKYGWHTDGRERNYVVRGHNKTRIYLHRLIMNAPDGIEIDHINGKALDNRKTNLRLATPIQNRANRKINNCKKYRGVFYHKNKSIPSYYLAQITVNYKKIKLGQFDTPEEAALAYNKAVVKYHGEFAVLNPIIIFQRKS